MSDFQRDTSESESSDGDSAALGIDERVDNAVSGTVTKARLRGRSPVGTTGFALNDDPVIEYLADDEQPHFILHADSKGPQRNGVTFIEPEGEYNLAICLTDRRIGLIAGKPGSDATAQIRYEDIEHWGADSSFMSFEIQLRANNGDLYKIFVTGEYSKEIDQLEQFLAQKIDIEYADEDGPILHLGDGKSIDDSILKIPTRDTGVRVGTQREAVLSESEYVRTEEKEYVVSLYEVRITDEEVFFRAADYDGGTEQVRRKYHQIDAVDLNVTNERTGIVLHIGDSIYELLIDKAASHQVKIEATVERIRELIERAQTGGMAPVSNQLQSVGMGQQPTTQQSQSEQDQSQDDASESDDAMAKLRELSELKEEGILTEGEFQQKKQELLDQI
jgi:hypothetical protein